MAKLSTIHSHRAGRTFAPIAMSMEDCADYLALSDIGININDSRIRQMMEGHGFDSNDVGIAPPPLPGITTASIATQIQFLQNWLPGFVRTITAAREIDTLIGMTTSGAWEDEEVVFGILEQIGTAEPYTDIGNVPLATWNANFERRTVVRFEKGISVGTLEELRAARMRISTSSEKRSAASVALDIQRNRVGFYGYNDGSNRTHGFLNDPNLPAYITLPNGADGSPLWSTKTFLEICRDIRINLQRLRVQSLNRINPKKDAITMALPMGAIDFLTVTPDYGNSVLDWMAANYPNVRIESAPELDDANGGASAMYLYADVVDDGASDNSRTFDQIVPSQFFALGVEKRSKSYIEDYSNATAGTLCKRPYAVIRTTGL